MPKAKITQAEVTVPCFYRVHVVISEDMLGTAPSSPDIYTQYVASKAFAAEKKLAKTEAEKQVIAEKQEALTKEELATLPEDSNKGVTVFRRDPATGALSLTDTMVRGHLKEAGQAMGCDGSSWGLTSKIDRWVYCTDEHRRPIRLIPILRDGHIITAADDVFERPLRAMTMQGPRVTLAASERIKAPVTLDYYLYIVGLGSTKGKLTLELLRSWLSWGVYTGYGQYRTGGYGRFDATIEAVGE